MFLHVKQAFGYAIIIIFVFLIYLNKVTFITTKWNVHNLTSEIKIVNETKSHLETKTKYILYWTKMFNDKDFLLGFGSEIFKDCPINNCFTTKDKSLKEVDEFNAILFHVPDFNMQKNVLPARRKSDQIYVFATVETPFYYQGNYLHYTKEYFNWTMTYRHDSDIVRTYGRFRKVPTDYRLPSVEEIKEKPKKVAWLASNCNSNSKREVLVANLNKYIQVDSYGNCGTLKCVGRMSNECYRMLEKNYRFYLSFENAVCEDYITEKLYNILKLNLVPVVFGGGNYTINAPPHSYIDVRDFKRVKELGDYLNFLMDSYDEYLKYFEWKKDYVVEEGLGTKETLCQLCEKLHNVNKETNIYEDVALWWRGNRFDKCTSKDNLPPIH